MTRLEIQTYALNMLQANASGAGAGIWTAAEIQQYIRDFELKTFLMIAGKHENFFRTTTTLSEVSGTATINLPTNLFRVLRIDRISGGQTSATSPAPLVPIDRNDGAIDNARGSQYPIDLNGTGLYPMYYQLHGQKIIELLPTPAISVTNSLNLIYVYRPAAMASDSDTPFQASAGAAAAGTDNLLEFHDIIALGVVERCFLKEESYAQYDRIKALRQEREAELVKFLTQMQTQAPRGINVSQREWEW